MDGMSRGIGCRQVVTSPAPSEGGEKVGLVVEFFF